MALARTVRSGGRHRAVFRKRPCNGTAAIVRKTGAGGLSYTVADAPSKPRWAGPAVGHGIVHPTALPQLLARLETANPRTLLHLLQSRYHNHGGLTPTALGLTRDSRVQMSEGRCWGVTNSHGGLTPTALGLTRDSRVQICEGPLLGNTLLCTAKVVLSPAVQRCAQERRASARRDVGKHACKGVSHPFADRHRANRSGGRQSQAERENEVLQPLLVIRHNWSPGWHSTTGAEFARASSTWSSACAVTCKSRCGRAAFTAVSARPSRSCIWAVLFAVARCRPR